MKKGFMRIDIQTLEKSFRRLTPKMDLFTASFYETLFDRHPETLPLFAGVRFDEQKKKLARAIALVVRNMEKPEFLTAYLQGLGAIHVAYGVKAEHYPMVVECMMDALAETLSKAWTPEVDAAWREALRHICDTMIAGANRMR